METRLSRNIPKFQYKVLRDDPKIIQLKNMVEYKLRKKDILIDEDGSANLRVSQPPTPSTDMGALPKPTVVN